MESPTSRSLAYLKKQGYTAQVTEKWNPYARIRQDLFGFIDIIAIKCPMDEDGTPYPEIVGVQTTSRTNMNARIIKVLGIPEAKLWLESGGKIEIHGWSKKGKSGERKLWHIDIRKIYESDFTSLEVD